MKEDLSRVWHYTSHAAASRSITKQNYCVLFTALSTGAAFCFTAKHLDSRKPRSSDYRLSLDDCSLRRNWRLDIWQHLPQLLDFLLQPTNLF